MPSQRPLDEIDRQIIALLRENARRSYQDIGGRVALSAPAVKRRVDKLEKDGVIRGYGAIIDPATMGWNTLAIVELYCEGRMPAAQVKALALTGPSPWLGVVGMVLLGSAYGARRLSRRYS